MFKQVAYLIHSLVLNFCFSALCYLLLGREEYAKLHNENEHIQKADRVGRFKDICHCVPLGLLLGRD